MGSFEGMNKRIVDEGGLILFWMWFVFIHSFCICFAENKKCNRAGEVAE